jgi:hypothetical protein
MVSLDYEASRPSKRRKYLYTEEEVAKTFLANAFLTPVSLMLNISTLPFQLGYLILIKLITYIIKRQRR